MDREYDIFEELPDGSPLWRDHAVGLRAATLLLEKIGKDTLNECFAMCLHDRQIVARTNVRPGADSKPVIFQIAYDQKLSAHRADVLRHHGYEVITVIGNEAAKLVLGEPQTCDLFLVGNGAVYEKRREIVKWLKLTFPRVPVMGLNSTTIEIPEADFNVRHGAPETWLPIVAGIINRAFGRGA